MIKRKKKICKKCGHPQYIFSKGLCKSCWSKENKPKFKSRGKIKKVSNRGYERNKFYKKARLDYLETHPCCEAKLPGCLIPNDAFDNEGLQIHHKKGRTGDLLWDKRYFLAVCHSCHRAIEDFPNMAISHGWSLSRHSKDIEADAPEISE